MARLLNPRHAGYCDVSLVIEIADFHFDPRLFT